MFSSSCDVIILDWECGGVLGFLCFENNKFFCNMRFFSVGCLCSVIIVSEGYLFDEVMSLIVYVNFYFVY